MSTPVGNTWDALDCRLYVDGVRVADGSQPGDDDTQLTALAGLSVTWGRTTTVEQPAPATCSIQLMDLDGSQGFLETLNVGRLVDVEASGQVYSGSVDTVADPTFNRYGVGLDLTQPGLLSRRPIVDLDWHPEPTKPAPYVLPVPVKVLTLGGTVSVGPRPLYEADGIRGTYRRARVRLLLPPASLPTAAEPDLWDTLPTTTQGEPWTATLTATLPIGAVATVQVVGIRTPTDWDQDDLGVLSDPVPLPPGGGTVTIPFVAIRSGTWPALLLSINPTAATYNQWPIFAGETFADVDPAMTYDSLGVTVLTSYQLSAPSTRSTKTVRVFSGRITDCSAIASLGGVQVDVTAVDTLGQLASMLVATSPLPAQLIPVRVAAFLTAAGYPGTALIDTPAQTLEVGAIDVDRQPALSLLQDIAGGLDLILWGATHRTTGPYIWIEDPRARLSTVQLVMGTGGLVEIGPVVPGPGFTTLSACDLLMDPIEWRQDVSDVATRVAVQWQNNAVVPPAGVTLTVVDPNLEPADGSPTPYGVRSVSVSSQTTSSVVAQRVALQLLSRLNFAGWRMTGATWDITDVTEISPESVDRALTLLDGTARIGRAVQVVDLPVWSPLTGPQPGYLEGGQYAYTGDGWVLSMTISRASGIGPSAKYNDLAATHPGWRYIDFDPSISYNDLIGVGP